MTSNALLDTLDPDLANRIASKRDLFLKAGAKLGALATTPVVLAAVSTDNAPVAK